MSSKKKLKTIPKFKSEEEEFLFWQDECTADYFDIDSAQNASFPNLKPTTKSISIRLPKALINDLKSIALQKDVPYQSLMKIMLADAVKHEHTFR